MAGRSSAHRGAAYSFATSPSVEIPRSQFNRSCGLKTAFDSGYLIPIFLDEALPGDTLNLKCSSFARMNTPIFPIIDNLHMDFFWFAVPNRLIWDNWQKFNGEQVDPGDSTDFTVPTMTENVAENSLSDFMGIPIGNSLEFNSLWHRAYNLVWNEWFRSEDLQDSVVVDTDDGPDTPGDYVLLRRGKRHDYFTSCLPFTQKGDPVSLPLGTSAPVVTNSQNPLMDYPGVTDAQLSTDGAANPSVRLLGIAPSPGSGTTTWGTETGLEVDLEDATAATINDIRQAFQIQRLLERDARGGSRYTEIIRSHFGVVSPDQRLQRPEYLGGGSTRVNINPVAATTKLNYEVGELGGFGLAVQNGAGFTKSFTEHCVIIGLVNVRADLTYQQGLPRMFSRQGRYDFFWPALQHLGEQAVLTKEIFADGTSTDNDVFGYQERYAEYRYKQSHVTGTMRSTAAAPLDSWHLALDFVSAPTLNASFIEDDPPVDRVLHVPTQPHFNADFWFDYKCARPMASRSVPGLIDHF